MCVCACVCIYIYMCVLRERKRVRVADNGSTQPVYFVAGTPVPSSDSVKYLGSQIAWSNPTKKAIDERKALAHTRYMKLQPLWRSRLSRATEVKIYQASIVPALTYGLDTLSFEVRHLKPIDAWYYQHLRRSRGMRPLITLRFQIIRCGSKRESPLYLPSSSSLPNYVNLRTY